MARAESAVEELTFLGVTKARNLLLGLSLSLDDGDDEDLPSSFLLPEPAAVVRPCFRSCSRTNLS